VNVQDAKDSSPVHRAVAKNNLEILKLLLSDERKEEVELALALRDEADLTPILMAAKLGLTNILKYFIEELSDETWREDAVSMTYLALEVGCEDILDVLKHNHTVWSQEWRVDDQTFLQKAVITGNIIAVETIINRRYFTDEDWIPAKNLVKMKLGNDDKWKKILDLFLEEEKTVKKKMKPTKEKNKSNTMNTVKNVMKVWSKLKPSGNDENVNSNEDKFTVEHGLETGKEGSLYEANMGYNSDE